MNAIVCPRCGDPVRVPSVQIPDDAMLRCKWCSESFSVSELNDRLPPLLQIVSPNGEVLSITQSDGFNELQSLGEVSEMDSFNLKDSPPSDSPNSDNEVSSLGISGDALMVSEDTLVEDTWKEENAAPLDFGDEVAVDEFSATEDIGTIAEEAVTVEEWPLQAATDEPSGFKDDIAPMRVNPRGGRAQKNTGSPIMMALKVIGGGLLSVPLAGAILTAIGKPLPIDLGFWPFLGDASAAVASGGNRAAPLPAAIPQPKTRGSEVQRPEAQIMQPPPEVTELAQQTKENVEEFASNPIPEMDVMPEQSLESELEASPADEADSESIPESTFAMPELEDSPEPELKIEPELDLQPEPQESPTLTASLPETALAALDRAILQFDAAANEEDAKKQKLFLQQGFIKACEAAGELPSAPTADPAVAGLFAKIRDSQAKTLMSTGAWQWIGMKNRETDGILLIGDTAANSNGTIITVGNGKIIEVESELTLPEGRVIGLGQILGSDNPPRIRIVAVEPAE